MLLDIPLKPDILLSTNNLAVYLQG